MTRELWKEETYLKMISEMVDFLILVQVNVIELSSDPVLLSSIDIPFQISFSFLPMSSLEGIIYTVTKLGLERDVMARLGYHIDWVGWFTDGPGSALV